MSARPRPATVAAALVAAAALAACGLTAPRSNEGYADLDSLGLLDTDRVMALSIGPSLLNFAARHLDDDPGTQALLRSLDGVRVRIYEIDGDPANVAGRMARMNDKLTGQGWAPVAVVQEDNERSYMLMKDAGDIITGLTVITSDGEEAVVVNVMGDLQPEYFSDTMAILDVPAPEVQVASVDASP